MRNLPNKYMQEEKLDDYIFNLSKSVIEVCDKRLVDGGAKRYVVRPHGLGLWRKFQMDRHKI